MMTRPRLFRTWATLSVLTAASTSLHFSGLPAQITGSLILLAAWTKARLILLDYLELRGIPGWSAGLQFCLLILIALLLTLFLAA